MNRTNRFANRLLLAVVGLVLLVLGLGAIGLALAGGLAAGWDATAPRVLARVEAWLRASPIAPSGPSWPLVAAIALLVLAIVGLLAFALRQGRGRTGRLLVHDSGDGGTTIVEAAVAADVLRHALAQRAEVVSSHVSAYTVHGTPVLEVAVACRRGTSPRAMSEAVEGSLRDLSALVGADVPALVRIGGGLRTRFSAPQRLALATAVGAEAPADAHPPR